MGVPSYFGWIMKQIKKYGLYDMVHYKLIKATKRLYFDFNCLIHRACRECQYGSEDDMINNVVQVLKNVIEHVNPSDLVYISVDGSVPMGKCKQQRFRRFKSIKEKREIAEIYKNHQTIQRISQFDFNAISPGTEFMDKLGDRVEKAIEEWNLKLPNLKFIFSSCHEPGEGEHKIVKHIKASNLPESEQIVIYGLDADLIFLSLGLHHQNTFLFRENLFKESIQGVKSEYLYMNIGELYQNVVSLIVQPDDLFNLPTNIGKFILEPVLKYSHKSIINDYIFFNFFLGNDFVNRIYCLSIKNQGCEIMMQIYRYCLRQQIKKNSSSDISKSYLLLENNSVNLDFLKEMLEHMAEYEEYWWTQPPKSYQPRPENGLSHVERDVTMYGFVDKYLSDIGLTLLASDFKKKYYNRLFSISQKLTLEKNISLICNKYLSTIRWTLNYYLDSQTCDWDWYYPYEYAPLIDDLIGYLKTVNDVSVFDTSSKPISSNHQLMIILPPESFHLLPEKYSKILKSPKFEIFYPRDFDFHYYGHRFIWECPPKIPILDSRVTKNFWISLS